ncbi:hypothetical protein BH20ACI2_BH20ACI2_02020 [soil metagenome]
MQGSTIPGIVSGDGDSAETAVEFEPCDRTTRVMSEDAYITRKFGQEGVDWIRGMHFTQRGFISEWQIELADGSSRSVYFDTSVSLDKE